MHKLKDEIEYRVQRSVLNYIGLHIKLEIRLVVNLHKIIAIFKHLVSGTFR